MKVMHIMSGFGGGISSFILNKTEYFQDKDISFDVITFNEVPDHFLNAIQDTGGEIHYISNPKRNELKKFYKQVDNIMSKVAKDTFIHCHMNGYRAIPFYLIAKKNKLKKFAIHTHTTGLPKELNSIKFKTTRFINNMISNFKISCSKESSKYLFGQKHVDNKNIMHIPNSINPQKFLKDLDVSEKELLGNRYKNQHVIGHIGRFTSVKNHAFMLSVIEILVANNFDFLWLFIGDGMNYEKIKKQAKEKGLEKYIYFLGRRNDISELLQIMDVFVLPSKREGFPTVAVESQTSGIKTLLSDRVTEDVDLKIGLVDFLSIDNPEHWAEHILANQTHISVNPSERLNVLIKKNLTNETSAKLYQDFLENKISNYEI